MICSGNSPTIVVRGTPGGRQNAAGSSIPRLLKDSTTFFAAQGWYGAASRPGTLSPEAGGAAAEGSFPVPPTPNPEFASSQLPRRLLPPCHTPVRSGWPSAARGTALFEPALFLACAAAGETEPAKENTITALSANVRIILSPPQAHCRHP